jgi:hypothetical protein
VKTLRETILKNSWQEDMVGPHLVRVNDALSALRQWLADEGLVVVPRDATPTMSHAGESYMETMDDDAYAQDVWHNMIAAAPDALNASDGAPPSPGAITGIRKAADPCSDCIDGWCQMNCGPRIG